MSLFHVIETSRSNLAFCCLRRAKISFAGYGILLRSNVMLFVHVFKHQFRHVFESVFTFHLHTLAPLLNTLSTQIYFSLSSLCSPQIKIFKFQPSQDSFLSSRLPVISFSYLRDTCPYSFAETVVTAYFVVVVVSISVNHSCPKGQPKCQHHEKRLQQQQERL